MNEFDFKQFGSGIKYYREKSNMTEEYLAEKIDSNQNYISLIENGKARPSVKKVTKLCNALNISVSASLKREKAEHSVMYRQFKKSLSTLDTGLKPLLLQILQMLNEIEG